MRLFVAINLPAATAARLSRDLEPLRASDLPVRWTTEDALHLTLKFLGAVAEQRAAAIGARIEDVARRYPPLPVRIDGMGAFPDARRPRIFWMGVAVGMALASAAASLDSALVPLGFPADERPFRAHITVGRVRGNARLRSEAARSVLERPASDLAFTATTLDLMRSRTDADRARYETLLRAPFATRETTPED